MYSKAGSVRSDETPFTDDRTVFSVCAACPVLTDGELGAATVCQVSFADQRESAAVICAYGPGGNTTSSLANNAVTGIPNVFSFCETRCPDEDALHWCSVNADATGVTSIECVYGKHCD